jgi:hypothetical protein
VSHRLQSPWRTWGWGASCECQVVGAWKTTYSFLLIYSFPLNSTVLRLFNTTNSSTAVVKDRLTVSLRNTLGEEFTIEVIYHTIKQMKPLAAPCSDSIPALFYQKKLGHCEMVFLQWSSRFPTGKLILWSDYHKTIVRREKWKSNTGVVAIKLESIVGFSIYMGFPTNRINLIMKCINIKYVSFSVLLNRRSYPQFFPERGFIQGIHNLPTSLFFLLTFFQVSILISRE